MLHLQMNKMTIIVLSIFVERYIGVKKLTFKFTFNPLFCYHDKKDAKI